MVRDHKLHSDSASGMLQFMSTPPPISQPSADQAAERDALEGDLRTAGDAALRRTLDEARSLLESNDNVLALIKRSGVAVRPEHLVLGEDGEALRWFAYPSEALAQLRSSETPILGEEFRNPLRPVTYVPVESAAGAIDVERVLAAAPRHSAEPISPADDGADEGKKNGEEEKDAVLPGNRATSSKYPLVCSSDKCFVPRKPFKPNPASTATTFTSQFPSQKWPKPPKKLMKFVGEAIREWDMIREGDRLLLGLSGEKIH